ncbi:centrin, EF-hand protein [Coemansia biformis]|uniref:Centrin, EF-hand protein n=1 Tax=Coemansia biformis TaxID=1286918 RepID=A0A9W7YAN7_9FUNG|nr:centrin, EF-hand protein [Coemansia biformis]
MNGENFSSVRRARAQQPPAASANTNRLAPTTVPWKRPPAPAARKIATPSSRLTPHAVAAPSTGSVPAAEAGGGGIGNLDFEQREELRDIFDRMDKEGRGFISVSTLPDIIRAFGIEQPMPETWAQWRLQVDPEGTGRIGYNALEEFISLRYDEMSQRQEILNAFRLFKPDSANVESARITLDDLRKISVHLGEHIPDEELQEMIGIADIDGSGSVGFGDFARIMRKSGLF